MDKGLVDHSVKSEEMKRIYVIFWLTSECSTSLRETFQ